MVIRVNALIMTANAIFFVNFMHDAFLMKEKKIEQTVIIASDKNQQQKTRKKNKIVTIN